MMQGSVLQSPAARGSDSGQALGRDSQADPGGLTKLVCGNAPAGSSPESILSRFRPIAPKPMNLRGGGGGESGSSAPSDPPSSSTLSVERSSGTKTVSSDSSRGGKRGRSRSTSEPSSLPASAQPRPKRTAPPVKPRTIPSRAIPRAVTHHQQQLLFPEGSVHQTILPIPATGGGPRAVRPAEPKSERSPDGQQPAPPTSTGSAPRPMTAIPNKSGIVPAVPQFSNGAAFSWQGKGGTSTSTATGSPELSSTSKAAAAAEDAFRIDRSNFALGFGTKKYVVGSSDWDPILGGGGGGGGAAPPSSSVDRVKQGPSPAPAPAFMGRGPWAPSSPTAAAAMPPQQLYLDLPHAYRRPHNWLEGILPNSLDSATSEVGGHFAQSPRFPLPPRNFLSGSPQHHSPVMHHPSFTSSNDEGEVISGGGYDQRKALVTLPLLPETPSQSAEYRPPTETICPATSSDYLPDLSLSVGTDYSNWGAENRSSGQEESLHTLPQVCKSADDGSSGRPSSSSTEKQQRLPRALQNVVAESASSGSPNDSCPEVGDKTIDDAYMEKHYSEDPTILESVDGGESLWANQAYRKFEAAKAKDFPAGPYLDPLGSRMRLNTVRYHPPGRPAISAYVMGFLKTFIRPENGVLDISKTRSDEEEERNQQKKMALETGAVEGADGQFPSQMSVDSGPKLPKYSSPGPIAPQAVRPVGSMLMVESVENMTHFGSPVTDTVETVKVHLDSFGMPAVITDCRNRVRWVNAAYKKLTGQPECAWLDNAATATHQQQPNRVAGEVLLVYGDKLSPLSISSRFSCRVRVRWTKDGKEQSATAPCDVTRIQDDKQEPMFIWKLNILSS